LLGSLSGCGSPTRGGAAGRCGGGTAAGAPRQGHRVTRRRPHLCDIPAPSPAPAAATFRRLAPSGGRGQVEATDRQIDQLVYALTASSTPKFASSRSRDDEPARCIGRFLSIRAADVEATCGGGPRVRRLIANATRIRNFPSCKSAPMALNRASSSKAGAIDRINLQKTGVGHSFHGCLRLAEP